MKSYKIFKEIAICFFLGFRGGRGEILDSSCFIRKVSNFSKRDDLVLDFYLFLRKY